MGTFLLIVHIIVCFVLIVTILLQSSKGGGLSGAFGGAGGGGAVFGGAGAGTFLSKVTTYLAIAFFVTCIGLWYTYRSDLGEPATAAERMMQERGPVSLPQQSAPQPLPNLQQEAAPAAQTQTPADSAK
ncbi:MAG: preprotein translocase subunit SecG [bacterium]|nr:preprotein translocase subunit SecG [bacterium]